MVRHHPLLGDGAGSFARAWARERPVANGAQDAHNLYLETLAELGPVGLVLLLIALVAPALVVRRVRINASASAAAAGLAAFVVHAAIDWDWEIPVLTLSAIACAAVLVVLDPDRRTLPLTTPRRVAGVAVVAASLATALIVHVGNRAASDARQALASGDGAMALAAAERAQAWMPWNPAGNQLLGEALLAEKRDALARSALQEAVQRDPADWSIWYDLARASRGSERANALTRARELNPLSIEVGTLAADT
jgi:Flp pilus assembly protein TadD